MRNIVNSYVQKFKKEHRKRWRAAAVLIALALAVTVGVSWQLHSTGIALTNETYCGLEEHTHSEDCYKEVLVCGLEKSEEHTHSEECYEMQLVCGQEEHTHTVECLSDETADVETASDWSETLPGISGVLADDVVAVAGSQVGYTESVKNFILAEDGETRQGYTRYGAWYGDDFEYVDWDVMFASFCLYYAGIDEDTFPLNSGAYAWATELESLGYYEDAADAEPVAGDLIFLDEDGDGRADRAGIIAEVNKNRSKLTVIEGDYVNDSGVDAVVKNTYTATDGTILGYAMLPEDTASAEDNEETSDSEPLSQQELTVEADGAVITVSGMLPEDAAVTANPVEVENDDLDILLAFDITIYYADGTVFEPEDDTISVTIESGEISGSSCVYYIPDDGDAERMASEVEDGIAVFNAEHFSVYVIAEEPASQEITTTYTDSNDHTATLTISSTSSTDPLLTGKYASINISLGVDGDITWGDNAVRVYLDVTDAAATNSDGLEIYGSASPGTTTWAVDETKTFTLTGSTTEVSVTLKQDANGDYYLEIDTTYMTAGTTLNFYVSMGYPNETSAGGGVMVTGAIGSSQTTDDIEFTWTTQTDTYNVTKNASGTAAFESNSDGNTYLTGLEYTVKSSRSTTRGGDYGKNGVTTMIWTDTLMLPEGLSWRDGLIEAIRNNEYTINSVSAEQAHGYEIIVKINGETYTLCTFTNVSTNSYYDNVKATVDSSNNIVITWDHTWSGKEDDESAMAYTTTITYGDEVIVCKTGSSGSNYVVNNEIKTQYDFRFPAESQTRTDTADVTVTLKDADLELTKDVSADTFYMGSSYQYTITAEDIGSLPYTGMAYIEDTLNDWLYIKPGDMETLLSTYDNLTITIKNATLYDEASSVTGTVTDENGNDKDITQQEQGTGTSYNGNKTSGTLVSNDSGTNTSATITLTKNSDGTICMVVTSENGTATTYTIGTGHTYTTLSDALDGIGYYVTQTTTYTLLWNLGDSYTLYGNSPLTCTYTATVKDTFMRLTGDQFNDIIHSDSDAWTSDNVDVYGSISNTATAYGTDYKTAGSSATPLDSSAIVTEENKYRVYRDFVLTKDYTVSGNSVTTGSIVTYTVTVKHEGNASYDALPLVDQLGSNQVLLVPVSENSANTSLSGLTQTTVNGTAYYVLKTAGIYENVWINSGVMADKIVVSSDGSTLIYCYLVLGGNTTRNITYATMSNGSGVEYSLKNQVWLNDHETHRLYAETSVNGSVLSIEKQIVATKGGTPSDDLTTNTSVLSTGGQQVTYRLELKNNSDNAITVTGDRVYDALPANVAGDPWEAGDIQITVDKSAATFSGGDADAWTNGWSVTTIEPDSGATTENNSATQCYLVWNSSHTVTFTGSVYIYVTLTYPNDESWNDYYNAYQATQLVNTFHAYVLESSAYHTIKAETEATLFKGVYATGLADGTNSSSNFTASTEDNSLTYYTNDSANEYGYVQYYVVLYNEGPVNLYLQTLTDTLPDGFTYINDSMKIASDIAVKDSSGNSVTLITDCTVADTASKNTSGTVSFNLSGGSLGHSDVYNAYYLEPGQAVVFTYKVATDKYSSTYDTETNTITMPFYDVSGGGLVLSDEVSVDTVSGSWYQDENLRNDGDAEILNNADGTQSLTSSVDIYRGEIRPGITKKATAASYTNEDVITWNVTVTNEGDSTMMYYYIYDEIESPYTFYSNATTSTNSAATGLYPLYYTVYDSNGNSTRFFLGYFLSFDENTWSFRTYNTTSNSSTSWTTKTTNYGEEALIYGKEWGNMITTSRSYPVRIAVIKDGDNYVLRVGFTYTSSTSLSDYSRRAYSIPSGGYGVLTVSTKNNTTTYTNGTIENTSYITPVGQEFSNIGTHGIEVPAGQTDGEEIVAYEHSVESKASVPVNYGSGTTSSKAVTELDADGNAIAGQSVESDTSTERLQLTSSASTFRYTLTVENGTTAMSSLVLYDSLPEEGDVDVITGAARYSQFDVSLAADPKFEVTVTVPDTGGSGTSTSYTLNSGKDYKIEYTDSTSAENLTDSTIVWYGSVDNTTRAFRITFVFGDSSEGYTLTSLPANATVTVSFNAEIESGASSGETAWNSFSYIYTPSGSSTSISATPLQVGVQVPYIPTLEKQVKDADGNTASLTADTTYIFLIYEGAALSGVDVSDTQELLKALNTANRKFTEVELTVSQGNGTAGMSLDNLYQYAVKEDSGDYTADITAIEWNWTNNSTYTIVELTQDGTYPFHSWSDGSNTDTTNTFTFTYSNGTTLELTCVNQVESYELPVTGGSGVLPYTIAGLLLFGSAGGTLLMKRRRRYRG